MGSEVEEVRRCEDKRTGPAVGLHIRFSGFSSQRGVPGRDPSESGGGEEGVLGAPNPPTLSPSVAVDMTLRREGPPVYTGMCAGEGGLLSGPGWEVRDTAESVETLRGGADTRTGSLALSTSGTLPLLPLLVSSDNPLSTPASLNELFFSMSVSITRGSEGRSLSLVLSPDPIRELLNSVDSPPSSVLNRLPRRS